MAGFLSSCNPTRRLADEEYLLDHNYIKVEGKTHVSKDQLNRIVKQKPNKRILWSVRFHLWVHNLANNGNDSSKIRKWFMEEVGEAPVVLDSGLVKRSAEQMQVFMVKKGYFKNLVKDSIVLRPKRQRAEVYYKVEPNKPYLVRNIDHTSSDRMKRWVKKAVKDSTLIHEGDPFDIDMLDKERERISEYFRDNGFYSFSKEYIRYRVDSSVGERKVDVRMTILGQKGLSPLARNDSVQLEPHKRYRIRNIYVNTEKRAIGIRDTGLAEKDTIHLGDGYFFIYRDELKIQPPLLVQSIFIEPGEIYKAEHEKTTYRRLSELRIFKSVNIRYKKANVDSGDYLDCLIDLSRTKTHSIGFESRGTNRGGNLGVSGNLSYSNRNIFRGAETFRIDLSGGLEAQDLLTSDQEEERDIVEGFRFNTLEFGPELSLNFPRFLLPMDPTRFHRSNDPSTRFSSSMNFQRRPDYTRTISNVSMTYKWNELSFKQHKIDLIDASSIQIDKSNSFQRRLREFNDRLLLESYRDHLIVGSGYGFTYNNQESSDQRNVFFYNGNFEVAGNSLREIMKMTDVEPDESGSYRILDTRFAQFVKVDSDLRFYRRINSKSSAAYRIFGGVGVPYGNLRVLPFQKSFFSGGANGIRAWKARTLGPGAFTDSTFGLSFDRIGDIKLEANVEYRFDLIKVIEGAFFLDAGNIWLLREDPNRPKGHFSAERFLSEIAMGGGFGLRVDLDFFIVRFDLGVPLKDPQLPNGERWFFQPKEEFNASRRRLAEDDPDIRFREYQTQLNLNLGIGYPF